MKRILLFCERDWFGPGAGKVEQYTHEVFTRIAAQGHYVAWMACRPVFPLRNRRPRLEVADRIQIARLGFLVFYPRMMKMFLSRLAAAGGIASRFDVVVDCVTRKPFPIDRYTDLPVIPIIFQFHPSLAASESMPGPVIATSNQVCKQLQSVGVPSNFIVHAPFGAPPQRNTNTTEEAIRPRLLVLGRKPRHVLKALRRLDQGGLRLDSDVANSTRVCRGESDASQNTLTPGASADALYARAAMAYCGPGAEPEALRCFAWGMPVIAPDTPDSREYVTHGETGLLHEPGNTRRLAECLRYLAEDTVFRAKLRQNSLREAEVRSWNRTAATVLAVIENA